MAQANQGSDQVVTPNRTITETGATLELTPEETKLIQFVRQHAPPDYASGWYEKLQGLTLGTANAGRVCFMQNERHQIVPVTGVMANAGSP